MADDLEEDAFQEEYTAETGNNFLNDIGKNLKSAQAQMKENQIKYGQSTRPTVAQLKEKQMILENVKALTDTISGLAKNNEKLEREKVEVRDFFSRPETPPPLGATGESSSGPQSLQKMLDDLKEPTKKVMEKLKENNKMKEPINYGDTYIPEYLNNATGNNVKPKFYFEDSSSEFLDTLGKNLKSAEKKMGKKKKESPASFIANIQPPEPEPDSPTPPPPTIPPPPQSRNSSIDTQTDYNIPIQRERIREYPVINIIPNGKFTEFGRPIKAQAKPRGRPKGGKGKKKPKSNCIEKLRKKGYTVTKK